MVIVNAGFAGLATVFDYPQVLSEPSTEVLALFRQHEAATIAWFALLAFGAILLIPLAVLIGGLDDAPAMRWGVLAGVAAGLVQAIGLLRWPLLVPSLAADAARAEESSTATETFELLNRVLGTILGETIGYLGTAIWTIIVATCLARRGLPRWFATLGIGAALLILTGLAAPWGVPAVQQLNFIGYLLWSGWLLTLAVLLTRKPRVSTHELPSTSSAPAH
ncbi:DUF4386 family protein [Nocardia sp. GCM10030253]|uniref:DUF4386 family protein n=1 Tax=Nocardia sp. GCM10030253 TaxID=3273404 RepID=UPI003645727A